LKGVRSVDLDFGPGGLRAEVRRGIREQRTGNGEGRTRERSERGEERQ
jgi:hypothetical protein